MVTFLEPEKIIERFDLKPDFFAAEFGCGPGSFTIALAKILPKGMVYGLDVQKEPLSALVGSARAEGLSNIRTIQCDLEEPRGSTLQDQSLDLVLVSNVLFQSNEKEAILREAKRIVKPTGKIIVLDWKIDSPFGPDEGRISLEKVRKMMLTKLDMKLVEEIDAGSYHWSAVFAN